MEYNEIEQLAERYRKALRDEYNGRIEVAANEKHAAVIEASVKAQALAEDRINGKNAEIRKLQLSMILADDAGYQQALVGIETAKALQAIREIARKHAEALISLTKAWLYSQSGIERG